MKKFKEKKIVYILSSIAIVMTLMGLVSLPLMSIHHLFGFGFILLLPAFIILLISNTLSEQNSYTSEFLRYIENKYEECTSLDELYNLRDEFEELAFDEDDGYSLSYPRTVKELYLKLIISIQILEKVNGTERT
jgi:hypothetical protein